MGKGKKPAGGTRSSMEHAGKYAGQPFLSSLAITTTYLTLLED